jgi:3-oxoadipate enol-lactonase
MMAESEHVLLGKANLLTRIDRGPGGSAPWIVLSNSLGADHTMWDPQISFLTRRYNVLRYDTRGHGGSSTPPGPYAMPDLVDDAVGIIDHFGLGKATFMGLSLGGMTGLGLALDHSDRLDRLICCDARADAPDPFRKSWDVRIAEVAAGGMQAILSGTVERWLHADTRGNNMACVESVEAMILSTSPAGYQGCAEALKGLDYRRRMAEIPVPGLFVVGEEDAGASTAVMQDMANAVPGARLAVIPHAAHLPNLDNPAAFNGAIAGFLGIAKAGMRSD